MAHFVGPIIQETESTAVRPTSHFGVQRAKIRHREGWLLAKHRIICANSLHDETYRALMGKARAAAVFTDPPFNVKIDGHATGNGSIRHREFAMASGEMSEVEFVSFLNNALRLSAHYSVNNSVHYVCMDWRSAGSLIAVGSENYDELLNMCVWVKNSGGIRDSPNYRPAAAEKKCLFFKPGLLAIHDDGTTVEPGTLETCDWEKA